MSRKTAYSELMIRIQGLRREIDDANRALVTGSVTCLMRFPEEVQEIIGLAEALPKDRRHQAIIALNALDADINAYTRILNLWQHRQADVPLQAVS